ncbi:MAG: hypothetical protein KGI57_10805, partial [Hyphomicrobiales bacterium]|nr:hypothetical protein [Hyphomicrobiales bacterium]
LDALRSQYAALSRDEAYARANLGPRHPTYLTTREQLALVRGQVAAELRRLAQSAKRDVAAADADSASAKALVDRLTAQTNALGPDRAKLEALAHDADVLRGAYEKELAARENVQRDVVDAPVASLVDPPMADPAPSKPRTLAAFLLALAGALNLWVVASLAAEIRARRAANRGATDGAGGRANEVEPAFRAQATVEAAPAVPAVRRDAVASAAANDIAPTAPPESPPSERPPAGPPSVTAPAEIRLSVIGLGPSSGDRSAPAGDGVAALRSAAGAMRSDRRYAAAVESTLDAALASVAHGDDAPFVMVAATCAGAGASSVALSLAAAAATRGLRALLVDGRRGNPSLSAFAAIGQPAVLARSGREVQDLGSPGPGDGVVYVACLGAAEPSAPRRVVGEAIDLVIVDGGTLAAAAGVERAMGAVDALVLVDGEDGDPRAREAAIAKAGFGGRCACVALVPTARRRAA